MNFEVYVSNFQPLKEQIEAVRISAEKAIAAVAESQSKKRFQHGDVIRLDVGIGIGSSFYNDKKKERKKGKRFGSIDVKIYIDGQMSEIREPYNTSLKSYRKWLRYYLKEFPKELLRHVEVSCVVVKCVWVDGGPIKKRSRPLPESIAQEFFATCERHKRD